MPSYTSLLGQLYRLTSTPGDAELLRRWVERRDEDAFTALVARHGRMVHGVCRRVLGNRHDAEDAFQAVFLILARKSAAIRHPEALPGWLHGVAVRLAYKARKAASRRRFGGADASAAEPHDPHPDPLDELSARELLGLIDREIARLPEVYRLPLVLCDLEDRTQSEAAALLGWTLGSLRGRLLRGRERLRTRLARRGIAPAVLATAFLQGTADAAALTAGVSRLAVRFATSPASADVSPAIATLVQEGIRGMALGKLKIASAVLLAASTLVAGAGLLAWHNPTAEPPTEESAESKSPATPPNAKPQVRLDQAGDPLPDGALSRLGTTRFRDGGSIWSLAFGPDDKVLVSWSGNGIYFWDTDTGKKIQRFAEQSQAQSMAVSPDGKLLAMRRHSFDAEDKTIDLRDFATGRLVRRFGDMETPSQLLFSPDGKVLAASDWNRQLDIELWNTADGHRLHTLKGHTDHVRCIGFSPDGKTLASGGDDKTIRFWDVAAGKELRQLKHHQGIGKILYSPTGKLLASIDKVEFVDKRDGSSTWYDDTRIRIWDTAAGKELRTFAAPKHEVLDPMYGIRALGFAPDGKTLLAGSYDGTIRIWDPATGKEMRRFPGFAGTPGPFAGFLGIPGPFIFTRDGKGLGVVEGGCTIRLFDLATGKDRVPSLGHHGRVSSISVSPDSQTIATIGHDDTLRFWNPATGRELRRRRLPPFGYFPFPRFQQDGRTYLSVGADRVFRCNDLASGKETAVLRGHKAFFPFALSPDGMILASTNADKEVRLLDPATGTVRHTLTKVKQYVTGMSFSGDSQTLVVWDDDRNVTVWDAATGKKRRQFLVPTVIGRDSSIARVLGDAYTAALSPDGKLIAFGLQALDGPHPKQGFLPVLDTTTGKEVCRFPTGKGRGEREITFSADSKSLAWPVRNTHAIVLGEIASGRERHRFRGDNDPIRSLAFSADDKMLISGSDGTSALVWDLTGRLTMGNKFGDALSAQELDTNWKALAGDDAAAGFRAVQALAADPVHSVPYLRTHLHPLARLDEKRLQQWIADLDSNQFAVREKAVSELEKAGAAALHALRKTLEERPTLEIRRRLEQLIEKQEREQWSPSAENLRSRRALEVLERVGTAEAKDALTSLANGAPGAWQTLYTKAALERLAQRPTGKP
jgi:RNA polymerase sigma factor (sigma-70 family)